MKKLLFITLLLWPSWAGATDSFDEVVTTCGNQTYKVGNSGPLTLDPTGILCTSGTGGGTSNINISQVGGIPVGTTVPVTDSALLAAVQSSIPAGTNIIGQVGIDQATPRTTNGVPVLTGSTTALTQATATNLK